MLSRLVPEGLIAILADCHDGADADTLRRHVRALVADVRALQADVARLTEALDAMSGDLLATMAERDAGHLDWMTAETARREAFEQRDEAEARAMCWRNRATNLRAALVAVGRLLPACNCNCSVAACVRCSIIRQRAEALGEVAHDG